MNESDDILSINYRTRKQYTYRWFQDFLHYRASRAIKSHTFAHWDGDDVVVSLHDLNLLRVTPEDVLTVSTGGFRTGLVKSRLNHLLAPYRIEVYQCDGLWYLRTRHYDYHLADTMVVDGPTGFVLSGEEPEPGRPIRRKGRRGRHGQPPDVPDQAPDPVENLAHLTRE